MLVGLVAFWSTASWATSGLFARDTMPTVLTAARLAQPGSEVPASVTVITRRMIAASGARQLFEVLQLVPGVNAALVAGNRPTVNYHTSKAMDSRRMLVLIDGRSVYQPGLARIEWNTLPIALADVERIEVTRGPAAAAYGANAFLGVINIITRDPEDTAGTRVAGRYGNDGVRDWRLERGVVDAAGSWRLSLSGQADDGYDGQTKAPPIRPPHSGKRVSRINFSGHWQTGPQDSVRVRAGGSRGLLNTMQLDDTVAWATPTQQPWNDTQRWFAQAQWQHRFSARHRFDAQVYVQHFDQDQNAPQCVKSLVNGGPVETGALLFTPELHRLFIEQGRDIAATLQVLRTNPPPYITQRVAKLIAAGGGPLCGNLQVDIKEERLAASFKETLEFDDWRLVAGMDLRHDRGTSYAYLGGTRSNNVAGIFTDVEWSPVDFWLLNVGGYASRDSSNGDFFSPRAASIFKLSPGQSLRFVYSQAVRTMDMYENHADIRLRLHDVNQPYRDDTQNLLGQTAATFFITQQATHKLDAEKIRSREIGYYLHNGSVDVDVRWFYEQLYHLVSQDTSLFSFSPDNSGRVQNIGWETQIGWHPTPRQLWRVTYARVNSHANSSREEVFSATNSGSLLWRYDVARDWMLAASWYAADDWNQHYFSRYSTTLVHKMHMSGAIVTLSSTLRWQDATPVVYSPNVYSDKLQFWLAAKVEF